VEERASSIDLLKLEISIGKIRFG